MSLLSLITGSVVFQRLPPIARVVTNPQYGVIGTVVKLDGQQSQDPGEMPGRSGRDSSTVNLTNIVSVPSGAFTSADTLRKIVLAGVDAGSYRVLSVVSTTTITVEGMGGEQVSFLGGNNDSWLLGDSLTYSWEFLSVPIGSSVKTEGFRSLDPEGSLVSFSPDIVGEYVIGLTVSNGVLSSVQATSQISIRAIMVPNARGIVPDGKFIWQYIRDVWQQVEGKEVFEALWSVLTQTVGGELLKLYQNDFNKSIRDIQDLYQRRWISYEPKLSLVQSDLTFFLGNTAAGLGGTTQGLDLQGQGFFINGSVAGTFEFIVSLGTINVNPYNGVLAITADAKCPTNIHSYQLLSLNSSRTGYKLQSGTSYPDPAVSPNKISSNAIFQFGFQSNQWTGVSGVSDIQLGDVIYYASGVNAGFYIITDIEGSLFTVDEAPDGASDSSLASAYRPSEFTLSGVVEDAVTNTFAVPVAEASNLNGLAKGRIANIGGQAFTVLRADEDLYQTTPMTFIVTDDGEVVSGQNAINWRVPNTLISASQNFEELGVTSGDSLLIDVLNDGSKTSSEIAATVVGVDGNRLGFVFTDEVLSPGKVPPIPTDYILQLANDFGVDGVAKNQDGSLTYTGSALAIVNALSTLLFSRTYFNIALTPSSAFSVAGGTFYLSPKAIIRNQRVPVDETLVSIPGLQNWLVQPNITQRNGKNFQIGSDGVEYPIASLPMNLVENSDYIIDSEEAFFGEMTFLTGTSIVTVDDGHFIDRGLVPGDTFEFVEPLSLAASNPFYITAVLSPTQLQLNKEIPQYQLGDFVTAKVRIIRKSTGHFLRFIPGGFTVQNPAPARFWAEVSYYNNGDSIESNFGILVGLTQKDLTDIQSDINYRQAVAGLMFAYTSGSVIDKIRLGAQILLGLPYAEHAGVVRSIEDDYRLDSTGTAIQGRILVEDTDEQGKPLGLLRVYLYPVDSVAVLAGLDNNPDTGVPYVVGDSVKLFASLSKGVEVNDYLTQPGATRTAIQRLQQYNSATLRANDKIFSISELSLVSTFFKRITPSYIALTMANSAEVADKVRVLDYTSMGLRSGVGALEDNPASRVSTPFMFDPITMYGRPLMFSEIGVFCPRLEGDNLATALGATSASIPGATLLTPAGEDGPVSRVGDYLFIYGGPNNGLYPITAIPSDTQVTVSGLPTSGFQTDSGRTFLLLRQEQALVRSGAYTSDGTKVSAETGLHSDGVAPGDLFVTSSGFCGVINRVGASASGSVTIPIPGSVSPGPSASPVTYTLGTLNNGQLVVTPPVPAGSGSYLILREAFLTEPIADSYGQLTLVSSGTTYTSVSCSGGNFFRGLVRGGDSLIVSDPKITLTAIDPLNNVFVPVLPAGTYTAGVCRAESGISSVTPTSLEEWDPQDVATINLSNVASGTATPSGTTVALTTGYTGNSPADLDVRPGDLLRLTSGGNSTVDVGYGPGVFPIIAVTSSHVVLAQALPSSDTSPWTVTRRR